MHLAVVYVGLGLLGERVMRMFAERRAVSGSMSEMESGIFPIFAKLILVGRKRSGAGEEHFPAGMRAYPGREKSISWLGWERMRDKMKTFLG